ncbi:hypothetical protein [uncultured Mediterranean phage uvDeep-CGR2-KM21-C368]|nr:hypothetical protein [uncultured Mediterranean phage uvDeep-CGR2-KM21-C368]
MTEKNNKNYHEQVKEILWEYVSDKDISEINKRINEIGKDK